MNKGLISISKTTSNQEPYIYVNLQILDGNYQKIITVNLDVEIYGKLLLGVLNLPCEYTIENVDKIGKTKEERILNIPIPFDIYSKDVLYELYVKQHEYDAWQANKSDIGNSHCIDLIKNQRMNKVKFYRFV